MCTCTRLCISSFSVTGERELLSCSPSVDEKQSRRMKINGSGRPLDEPTGVRVTVESLKRVGSGVESGGDEGARSKAAQHEGGSASQASMFHPWSIRKLALLSSFYRA